MNDFHPASVGTESADVSLRLPVVFVLSMAAFMTIALTITYGIYSAWSGPVIQQQQAARRHLPKENRAMNAAPLSAMQLHERLTYDAQQDQLLNSYDWIDRRTQVVRIPIDRAMERLAEQASQGEAAP